MSTIDEIADGIYRVHTPVPPTAAPGGFSYNQYLIVDEEPLLFHTGSRLLFPEVGEAIERVLPVARLRYISFCHWEQDECGSLDQFLTLAPQAALVCSRISALINRDGMSREPRVMADGHALSLGRKRVRWFETPHLPHGWESGLWSEESTKTLLCGDLFTQPGTADEPLVESDILGPSEELRAEIDYFAHSRDQHAQIERLARTAPRVLACMHGHAWRGNGAELLRELSRRI
jgi:flavorubredoxin